MTDGRDWVLQAENADLFVSRNVPGGAVGSVAALVSMCAVEKSGDRLVLGLPNLGSPHCYLRTHVRWARRPFQLSLDCGPRLPSA